MMRDNRKATSLVLPKGVSVNGVHVEEDFVLPNITSDPPSELPEGGTFRIIKK